MTGSTNNLGAPRIATAQAANQHVTSNDADNALDAAVTESIEIEVDDTNAVTIDEDTLTGAFSFTLSSISPGPTADIIVTLDSTSSRGGLTFINDLAFNATITCATQTATEPIIPPGKPGLIIFNGINARMIAIGAADDTGTDPPPSDTTDTDYKDSALVATTGPVTLFGEQTIDGQLTDLSRVLVWQQTDKTENGLYDTSPGAWTRCTDADQDSEVTSGMQVAIEEGATYDNRVFKLTTSDPITLGVTKLNFVPSRPTFFFFINLNKAGSFTISRNTVGRWAKIISDSPSVITIPAEADVSIAARSELYIERFGPGTVTIEAAPGVTLHSPHGTSIPNHYGCVKLKKVGFDIWTMTGDLVGNASDLQNDSLYVNGDSVADALDYLLAQIEAAAAGGVITFNGRSGAVTPELGDYTASLIGNNSDYILGTTVADALDNIAVTLSLLSAGIPTLASQISNDSTYGHGTTVADVFDYIFALLGNALYSDTSANLTAGFTATSKDLGTVSSGTVTPNPANGGFQRVINGGAFTLAPPSTGSGDSTSMIVQITNNASAGAVTTSGFTKVSGAFTTTNGDDFFCDITVCNGFSRLVITALQ